VGKYENEHPKKLSMPDPIRQKVASKSVLTAAKTGSRFRSAFAEPKKEREIPQWMFWKKSPKSKNHPH
jgi:hypothetical protein